MTSPVVINSLNRNVYEFPNSANFDIEAEQTASWNLIRMTSPAGPTQRTNEQYFKVSCCSLTLPMIPELLEQPGVYIVLFNSNVTKIPKPINFNLPLNHRNKVSGFHSDNVKSVAEIGARFGVVNPTFDQIRQVRLEESKDFHNVSSLSQADFFLICDKLQFNERGEAKWIHYKCCVDQVLPLNIKGNTLRFQVLDYKGHVIELTRWPGDPQSETDKDLWDESLLTPEEIEFSPINQARQVVAAFEFEYLPHKHIPDRHL